MIKTLIALRHMSDKEFGVEFYHEKVSNDIGFEFGNIQHFSCRKISLCIYV